MRVGEATNAKDLVTAVEALRQERLGNRAPFETVWWNNIALVAGDHYDFFEPTIKQFVTPKKDDHQIRLVLNQARVVARTELAKVTKSRPVSDVIANSSDEIDIAATKVGKFALEASEWKFSLRKLRKSAFWWTLLTGVSGVYVGWDRENNKDGNMDFYIDPNTGDVTHNVERIRQLKADETEGTIELKKYSFPMGDLKFCVYSPFQMLPDDTVLEWEEIKDIIVTDIVSLDQAKATWGDKAKDLSPENAAPGIIGQRMLRRIGVNVGNNTDPSEPVGQVHSYWLKPGIYTNNPFLKDGIMVRWANAYKMLEISEDKDSGSYFPYDDNRLPFAFFTHVPNAISIWPDTVMTDIRPINLELDKTISQLLENRDFMLNPMWRVPLQSQVQKIKSQPGGMVRYVAQRDLPPPEPLPGTPMPTQIENLVVGLRDQILDISGQGEVSRGRVPSGVRAGNMLAFLQEEDETKLGPTVENFEDAVAMMGSLILSRYGQYYTTERLLRAYKPGGQSDVRKFKGADLRNNTDVVVQAGSALPKLKAARQQYILELAQLGIETDPKRLRDMLELGEGEPDEVDLAFAQADRENEMMLGMGKATSALGVATQPAQPAQEDAGGQPNSEQAAAMPVEKWHNHKAHLSRHYREMSTVEFERLKSTHPDIVRIFGEHTKLHEEELQNEMMQQMQMAAMVRGGQPGVAPPPGTAPMAEQGAAAQAGGQR